VYPQHAADRSSRSLGRPVTREQRAKFEVAAGFPITENDATGTRMVAAERADYMPIVVQKRFDNRLLSLGFDLLAASNLRLAREAARDSEMPRAITIPEYSSAANPRFFICWPIFDVNAVPKGLDDHRIPLRDYLAGVFRVVDVLNGAIANTPDIIETLNFYLSNDPAKGDPNSSFQLVATYSPADHTIRACWKTRCSISRSMPAMPCRMAAI